MISCSYDGRVKILEVLKLCSAASNNLATTEKSSDSMLGRFVSAQMKVLALSIISEVYDTTANEHGEKMLLSAYPIAKKMRAETLCLHIGRLMHGWLTRNGADAERLHKQQQANVHHAQACQRIVSPTASMAK